MMRLSSISKQKPSKNEPFCTFLLPAICSYFYEQKTTFQPHLLSLSAHQHKYKCHSWVKNISTLFLIIFLLSCQNSQPDPITLNKDNCDFCKMTIANGQFASALKTNKGRTYKFDDISCMIHYVKQHAALQQVTFFVNDFATENKLIETEKAYFIMGDNISSPMGGHIAAFGSNETAITFQQKFNANSITWSELIR